MRKRPSFGGNWKRWLDDLCGRHKDTHFFVGNQHLHPESFLVLGAYYPKAIDRRPGPEGVPSGAQSCGHPRHSGNHTAHKTRSAKRCSGPGVLASLLDNRGLLDPAPFADGSVREGPNRHSASAPYYGYIARPGAFELRNAEYEEDSREVPYQAPNGPLGSGHYLGRCERASRSIFAASATVFPCSRPSMPNCKLPGSATRRPSVISYLPWLGPIATNSDERIGC